MANEAYSARLKFWTLDLRADFLHNHLVTRMSEVVALECMEIWFGMFCIGPRNVKSALKCESRLIALGRLP